MFNVEHGCTGADTNAVRIEVPAGATSVRPMTSDFGSATVEKDATGVVTAVTWQKADASALDGDTQFYQLTLHLKLPDSAFTPYYFLAHQTCRGADGGLSYTDWIATTPSDAGVEPAPVAYLVPARHPGWNKYTVPVAVADLAPFFGDAVIVWKGGAAYSASPDTTALIHGTSGVTALTSLAANDEIWVKY